MKIYERDHHYWLMVRLHILQLGSAWTKGSEGQALMGVALSSDWQQILMDHAPASEHISPRDCAGVVIRNLLLP